MKSIAKSQIILYPDECALYESEIKFWGLMISKGDVSPESDDFSPPKDKRH